MKKNIALTAVTVGILAASVPAQAATTEPTYLVSANSAASLSVLATSGNTYGSWMLPGTPDGMGAYVQGGKVQILVNHELSVTTTSMLSTIKRAGGNAYGSTITRLTVDPVTGETISAQEHLKSTLFYNYQTGKYSTKASTAGAPSGAVIDDPTYVGQVYHGQYLNRFCSAGFAKAGLLTYKSGKTTFGYSGSVFITGEETGNEGRAFATNTAGQLVQLPRLGLASWESFMFADTRAKSTVVIGGEDGSAIKSQLWLYVGTKTTKGAWYEKAGLTNGKNYVLNVENAATDTIFRATYGKTSSANVSFSEVDWDANGQWQNGVANRVGTGFTRIEDGAFDPNNRNVYYFVTTESNKDAAATMPNPATPTVSRDGGALWRLTFVNVAKPELGGKLEMLLDGSEAPYLSKPDNIEVDASGNVLIQEDPGNNAHRARLVAYNIATKQIATVAQFAEQYFGSASSSAFITLDEESSGVTEVTSLFKKNSSDTNKYYILDAQVHSTIAKARPDLTSADSIAAAIEGGQVYLLTISDWTKIYQ